MQTFTRDRAHARCAAESRLRRSLALGKAELLRPSPRKDSESRALSRSAVATSRSAAAAFARRIAIAAIDRTIASRLERNGSGLTATRTNHRSSL